MLFILQLSLLSIRHDRATVSLVNFQLNLLSTRYDRVRLVRNATVSPVQHFTAAATAPATPSVTARTKIL